MARACASLLVEGGHLSAIVASCCFGCIECVKHPSNDVAASDSPRHLLDSVFVRSCRCSCFMHVLVYIVFMTRILVRIVRFVSFNMSLSAPVGVGRGSCIMHISGPWDQRERLSVFVGYVTRCDCSSVVVVGCMLWLPSGPDCGWCP